MWAATFSASSFNVRFRRLSTGGWTWFCSFTDGFDACSRNWMMSCTGAGSAERTVINKPLQVHEMSLKINDGLTSKAEQTWVWFLQVFLQQAVVEEKLKPGSLKRRARPTAGHSGHTVCCFCTHPRLQICRYEHQLYLEWILRINIKCLGFLM